MKFSAILVSAGAALAVSMAAAAAQPPGETPHFVFNVERAVLQDEASTVSVYTRLVGEAQSYCGDIVARESVEFPVCVHAMVTHVINELGHAPLARLHDTARAAGPDYRQAVAFNAG